MQIARDTPIFSILDPVTIPNGTVAGNYTATLVVTNSTTGCSSQIYNVAISVINGISYYWVGNSGNWSDIGHWASTSGGTGGVGIPGSNDNVYFDANSFNTSGRTVTIDIPSASCFNVTWTGVTNTPSFNSSSSANNLNVYGSFTLVSGMNYNYNGNLYFLSNLAGNTITTALKTMNNNVYFNGTGSWTLQDNFTQNSWLNINLNSGTLNTNGKTVTGYFFYSNQCPASPRTLNLGASTWNVQYQWVVNAENFTLNAGTSTININYNNTGGNMSNQLCNCGNYTLNYNNVNFTAASGVSTLNSDYSSNSCKVTAVFNNLSYAAGGNINGDNTIGTLSLTAFNTYNLQSGRTQTISININFGSACNSGVTIQSNSSGSAATISKTSGVMNGYNLSLKDITATGGATFNAYASTNLGNNTGWNFAAAPVLGSVGVITENLATSTYSVVPVTGAVSYGWTPPAGMNIVSGNGTNSIVIDYQGQTGQLCVNASDGCGATSAQSCLTIGCSSPVITALPQAATICAGSTINLSVTATGSGLLYQWFKDGISILGASNSTYSLLSATSANSGSYTVKVTSSCGANVTSSVATVTVNQPVSNITVSGVTLSNGDYLWNGNLSNDGSVAGNWFVMNTGVYSPATLAPTSASKVYIVSYSDAGTCISNTNAANIPTSASFNSGNLFVGTGSTFSLSANSQLQVSGNLINNGTFNANTSTVTFNGASAQNIGGSSPTTFNNLTINNSTGLTLNNSIQVSGVLTLTSGRVTLGTNHLTLGVSASISGTPAANNMIVPQSTGELRKILNASNGLNPFIFPVGTTTGGNEYTPVQLDFLSATFGANAYVGVRLSDQRSTYMNSAITSYINRNWIVEPSNITNFTYELQLAYVQADYVGSAGDEGNLKPIKYSVVSGNGVWYQPDLQTFSNATVQGTSFTNSTSNVLIWSNLTTFSEFGSAVGTNIALPVELISFNGNCQEDNIVLNWQTASEYNSSHFVIEKSRDGLVWQAISTTTAAGFSNELINYTSIDNNPLDQQYYRLLQEDIDGTEKLYDPILVKCNQNNASFIESYPNPSAEAFNLIVKDKKMIGNCSVVLRDNNGKIVHDLSIEVLDGLNLFVVNKSLNPGLYFIEVLHETGYLITKKHVVK
jgi:hypothetical protein